MLTSSGEMSDRRATRVQKQLLVKRSPKSLQECLRKQETALDHRLSQLPPTVRRAIKLVLLEDMNCLLLDVRMIAETLAHARPRA